MDRPRSRPGHRRRTGRLRRRRTGGPVRPPAEFRHRRVARPGPRRARRDERGRRDPGQLGGGQGADRSRTRRLHSGGRAGRQARLRRLRRGNRRSALRPRVFGDGAAAPGAHPRRRLRGPPHRRRRRCADHRIPQPGHRQRLQGVLLRRPYIISPPIARSRRRSPLSRRCYQIYVSGESSAARRWTELVHLNRGRCKLPPCAVPRKLYA